MRQIKSSNKTINRNKTINLIKMKILEILASKMVERMQTIMIKRKMRRCILKI